MLLTFLVVCFAGLAFMFFCIQRAQEKQLRIMQEEHAQLRTVLRAVEARLGALDQADVQPESRATGHREERYAVSLEVADEAPADDRPLHLEGATVAQAAEMLRSGSPLLDMGLQMDEPVSRRTSRKEGNGMPELKI